MGEAEKQPQSPEAYEADSITPFVANSPVMAFFYAHPDQYAILDRAPVQYHTVTDRHFVPDDQRMGIVRDMQHAEILHIRPVPDADVMHIAPDHGIEPDAAILTQHDIADDDSRVLDEAGIRDSGFDAFECSDHGAHCR